MLPVLEMAKAEFVDRLRNPGSEKSVQLAPGISLQGRCRAEAVDLLGLNVSCPVALSLHAFLTRYPYCQHGNPTVNFS